MLEGLSAIHWESLTHAYGPADDVPAILQSLTSQDPEKWVGGIDSLYATLCHQTCTVYEATAVAVPFLIELLTYPEVRCRGKILHFLGDAARATSYLAAHGGLRTFDDTRDTPEFQANLATELEWVRQTRAAIWNEYELYLDFLSDVDKRLRITAPYTLGLLAQHATAEMPSEMLSRNVQRVIVERMQQQWKHEPSDLVRASLIFGLSALAPHDSSIPALLEQSLADPMNSQVVKFAAAYGLATLEQPLSPSAMDVLTGALQQREATNKLFAAAEPKMEDKHHPLFKAYREAGAPLSDTAGTGHDSDDIGEGEDFAFPWLEGPLSLAILERLAGAKLSARDLDRLLDVVAPWLDDLPRFNASAIAIPVLKLVFGDFQVTPATTTADLTPHQKLVITRLFDNPVLWATDTSHSSIFSTFGIPAERDELAHFLGRNDEELSSAEIKALIARLAKAQHVSFHGPEIKELNLRRIGTPAFLPHLADYPHLEKLDVSGMQLTDADLQHLRNVPRLKELHVPNALITDAGVSTLQQLLPQLEDLNISGTAVTDQALSLLQPCANLRTVYVWKLRLSAEALAAFARAKPQCKVWQD